jgi:hypothetical protein
MKDLGQEVAVEKNLEEILFLEIVEIEKSLIEEI